MTTPSDGTAAGAAPKDPPDTSGAQAHFRRTLVKVMATQVAALIVLWWIQSRYTP
jgi:hypothetical protein